MSSTKVSAKKARSKGSKAARKPSKATKKAKVPKVPENIVTAVTGSYTSKNGIEGLVRHKGSYKFASSGASYSVSSLMRWLGFHMGASGAAAYAWLQHAGFINVTRACAGHQSGSGRNTKADKKGNPAGAGTHGSVPSLTKEDASELKASYLAANPSE